MLNAFIQTVENLFTGLGTDLVAILAIVFAAVIVIAGILLTVFSATARNKRSFAEYNHEILQTGLASREDFYALDNVIYEKKSAISAAWTACYPTDMHTLVNYCEEANPARTIKNTPTRRNVLFTTALAFAVFCIPALVGVGAVAFVLPALVILTAAVTETVCAMFDARNQKRLAIEYNNFIVQTLKGIHRIFGVQFHECHGFLDTQASKMIPFTVPQKEKTEETNEIVSNDKSEEVKEVVTQPVSKSDEEIMQERIAEIAKIAHVKRTEEKQVKAKKKTVAKKEKAEKVTVAKVAPVKKQKVEKTAPKIREVQTTPKVVHEKPPEIKTAPVETKKEIIETVSATTVPENKIEVIATTTTSAPAIGTEARMEQLSARLAAFRATEDNEVQRTVTVEKVIKVEKTVHVTSSHDTDETTHTHETSQSKNETIHDKNETTHAKKEKHAKIEKAIGKYNENEVQAALAGLFGAMASTAATTDED
jgi:hypothetical protein